jgi:hypothetical protein
MVAPYRGATFGSFLACGIASLALLQNRLFGDQGRNLRGPQESMALASLRGELMDFVLSALLSDI